MDCYIANRAIFVKHTTSVHIRFVLLLLRLFFNFQIVIFYLLLALCSLLLFEMVNDDNDNSEHDTPKCV